MAVRDSFGGRQGQTGGRLRFLLTDAHAHIGSGAEVEERLRSQIPSMVCAGNPREAGRLESILIKDNLDILIPTYGLHPWYADLAALKMMQPFLERSTVIGEIGMDSVWCEAPLKLQQEVFEYQLSFAGEHHRPVILHTKGQEKTIADLIRRYPNSYLVHWYSSEAYQEYYLEMDCCFSIGPDVWWNPAVRKLAGNVPTDRLLIETDGMGAVQWAYGEAAEEQKGLQVPSTVEEALANTLKTVSEIRGTECNLLAEQIRANFLRFCGKAYHEPGNG